MSGIARIKKYPHAYMWRAGKDKTRHIPKDGLGLVNTWKQIGKNGKIEDWGFFYRTVISTMWCDDVMIGDQVMSDISEGFPFCENCLRRIPGPLWSYLVGQDPFLTSAIDSREVHN